MNIAIISGASSGIGREFVHQVDSYNFDEIWGIALEEDKLAQVQSEIKTKFVPIACDLTLDSTFDLIKAKLEKEKPDVKLLVNCSGFGKFGRYDEIPTQVSVNMTQLNCISLLKMTEYVLPYMHENSNIIEIASMAAFQPTPYIAVYSATKAYVLSYSRALNRELKPRKITVTALCPYWTKTNFFNVAETKKEKVVTKYVAMYNATDVVKRGLSAAKKHKDIALYGFQSKWQHFLVKMLPHSMVMNVWINQQKFNKKYK